MEVEVLSQPQLQALGMGGILAVGGGSDHPPALAAIRYRGAGDAPFLGLVGKGVTFDSGGISIKPAENMHTMRADMSGAAAVLGAMRAIAQLKVKANVLGVIATVENMPSGHAYRPGDVITTMSGKTIEVLNTDAEGRVILSDAVAYAQRQGANRLVDIATLTGACVIALGHVATGVMGTPQEWVDRVMAAGKAAGEKMWQLPLFEEYRDQIKSELADVANTGGRPAGTITGALFIKEFVNDGVPWVHLDIAGTDMLEKETPYLAKGTSGVGVRTFVQLAMQGA
jgi:leucyl aminopeptidase